MTKLEKGELVAFQIVTSPTVSSKVREHMLRAKNAIYQGKPLSPVLFKKSALPLPPALILILGPVVWFMVSLIKLLIAMPHLILDPKGPHAKYFLIQVQKVSCKRFLILMRWSFQRLSKEKLSEQLFETSIRLLIMTNTKGRI